MFKSLKCRKLNLKLDFPWFSLFIISSSISYASFIIFENSSIYYSSVSWFVYSFIWPFSCCWVSTFSEFLKYWIFAVPTLYPFLLHGGQDSLFALVISPSVVEIVLIMKRFTMSILMWSCWWWVTFNPLVFLRFLIATTGNLSLAKALKELSTSLQLFALSTTICP